MNRFKGIHQGITDFDVLHVGKHVIYPPDMALLATETVLEQAEQLADELSAA